MIFPEHCKYVGVRNCADQCCEPKIGDKIYFSSKFQIIFYNDRAAIYQVETQGPGLIRTITSVTQIANFRETLVYNKKVDIFNRGKLIKKTARLCTEITKAVIYQGFDEHWTFIYAPVAAALTKIEVFDISPPEPPYLITTVKKLDVAGVFGDLAVTFKPIIFDLRKLKEATIYPCEASGLGLNHLDAKDVRLVDHNVLAGCDISREIFTERFPNMNFDHINICPTKITKPQGPFIAKCCKTERSGPIEINGHAGYIVHWGANVIDIVNAVRYVIARTKSLEA